MKTLIESSIKFRGIGHPETKTVFSIENESERGDRRFKSLTAISGRRLVATFDYEEGSIKKSGHLLFTVIRSEDEVVIRQSIVDAINSQLA
jgi:hypothetical protein